MENVDGKELFSSAEESVNVNSINSDRNKNSDSFDRYRSVNINNVKTCTYFFNYGYCKFGNNCKYSHFKRRTRNYNYESKNRKSPVSQKVDRKEISNNSCGQTSMKRNCHYFKMGGCKKGESCDSLHSVDHISNEMDSLCVSSQSQKFSQKFFPSTSRSWGKRTTPVCYYFKKGLCLKGDNCKYYHSSKSYISRTSKIFASSGAENSNANTSLPSTDVKSVTSEGCVLEKNVTVFNRPMTIHDLSSLTTEVIIQLRCTEINQLKKRFPHFEVITENQTFSVLFEPSDPDWAFDLKKLKLEVDFPLKYPVENCKITVLHDAENIPHLLVKHLNKAICDWIDMKVKENRASNKTELIFRPFLKWFDKNLEDLFITGLRKVKQDWKALADGIEFVPAENLFSSSQENYAGKLSSSSEENIIEICTGNEPTNVDSSVFQEQTILDGRISLQTSEHNKSSYYPSNNGMKIIFTELEFIEGTGAFVCTKISATLQCSRCKSSFNMKSVPKKNNSHICVKCSKNVGFTFEPSTVHQFSNILGTLHLLDCAAVDINLVECHFLLDCLNCSKQVPADGIHYGQKHKMWCTFCNGKMLISVGSVKFQTVKLTTLSVAKYPQAKKIERKSKDPVVKEGEPLPNFGACKHYKKSFRWLRFPCCGRIYPCDECHNEKETDHEMKYASRMLCGFCAKEQPYSREKPCILCAQSLTKKSGSHWEGGKGCRNKIQMSREDKQKFSGVSKTVSRKAQMNKTKKKH